MNVVCAPQPFRGYQSLNMFPVAIPLRSAPFSGSIPELSTGTGGSDVCTSAGTPTKHLDELQAVERRAAYRLIRRRDFSRRFSLFLHARSLSWRAASTKITRVLLFITLQGFSTVVLFGLRIQGWTSARHWMCTVQFVAWYRASGEQKTGPCDLQAE